jgi:hypothetical protein
MPEEEDRGGLGGITHRPNMKARPGAHVYGFIAGRVRPYWDQDWRKSQSDEALIRKMPPEGNPHFEMEMQRRLKGAVDALTRELVSFREAASEDSQRRIEMSGQLRKVVETLTDEVVTSRKSSDKLAGRCSGQISFWWL